MRLPSKLSDAINFARWCQQERQDPIDVALLLVYAKRGKVAWEKSTWEAETSSKYLAQSDKWTTAFKSLAAKLGYGTKWLGLWPSLTKGNDTILLPDFVF